MNINNPGVLDGSVTTAKLANGAVTTAKCSTTDFAPTYTNWLNLNGNIESYNNVYPGLVLSNAASNQHWEIIENTSDGTHQAFDIYDDVNNVDCVLVAPGGSVTLAVPLPEASGGTGAASLAAGGVGQLVKRTRVTGQTTAISPTSIYTSAPAGWYTMAFNAFSTAHAGSYPIPGVTYYISSVARESQAYMLEPPSGAYGFGGSVTFYHDGTGDISYGTGIGGTGTCTYDLDVALIRLNDTL